MPAPVAQRVTVIDVDMPFGSMVTFMIKWALATIPALLILAFVGALAAGAIAAFVSGTASLTRSHEQSDRLTAYQRDLTRWREDCGQYNGRTAVASAEENEFRSCQAQKLTLEIRAGSILGAERP